MRNNQLTKRSGLSIMEIYNGQIILSWVSQTVSPRMWEFIRPTRNIVQNIYAPKKMLAVHDLWALLKWKKSMFFKNGIYAQRCVFIWLYFLKFYYRYLLCKVSYFIFLFPFFRMIDQRSLLILLLIFLIYVHFYPSHFYRTYMHIVSS